MLRILHKILTEIFMHPTRKMAAIYAPKGAMKFALRVTETGDDIKREGAAAELMSENTPLVR
jgi:hypothetical protein